MSDKAVVEAPEFRLWIPFEKVEQRPDGSVVVTGPVSSEQIDTEDEITDYDALKAAASDYMQFANLREMHDPHTAAGQMLDLDWQDDLRKAIGTAHVVDPGAVKKVLTGVYKGFSIGGRKLGWQMEKSGSGRRVRRLTKLWWGETSLVDRPANPDAIFTLAKRDWKETQEVAKSAVVAKADNPMAGDGADTGDNPEAQQGASETQADSGTPTPDAAPGKVKKVAKRAKPKAVAKGAIAKIETLRKGGNKTVKHLLAAMEEVVCAIGEEAEEQDTEDVTALQSLLTSMQKLISAEAAEPPEAGDVADDSDDEPESVGIMPDDMGQDDLMEMAAQITSLRKRAAKRDSRKIEKLRKSAKAGKDAIGVLRKVAGDNKTPDAAATPAADAPASELSKAVDAVDRIDELMQKVSSDRAVYGSALDDVKAELLTRMGEVKEELAKTIAAQPMSGGPIRPDVTRFGGEQGESAQESQALAKVLRRIDDPILREQLGKAAAAQQIGSLQQQS